MEAKEREGNIERQRKIEKERSYFPLAAKLKVNDYKIYKHSSILHGSNRFKAQRSHNPTQKLIRIIHLASAVVCPNEKCDFEHKFFSRFSTSENVFLAIFFSLLRQIEIEFDEFSLM